MTHPLFYIIEKGFLYAVICFSFFSNANITKALIKQRAIKMPQLYINGILFQSMDGAFNLESMYTDTEEVWFSNWEYDDAYWNKDQTANAKKTYENSPHKFVDKWDTPILCIHGEKDYRINANQGMGAFNAARLRGIPAELLIFPDENHWVLKPQNGILWQRTFFGWLDKWLKK